MMESLKQFKKEKREELTLTLIATPIYYLEVEPVLQDRPTTPPSAVSLPTLLTPLLSFTCETTPSLVAAAAVSLLLGTQEDLTLPAEDYLLLEELLMITPRLLLPLHLLTPSATLTTTTTAAVTISADKTASVVTWVVSRCRFVALWEIKFDFFAYFDF